MRFFLRTKSKPTPTIRDLGALKIEVDSKGRYRYPVLTKGELDALLEPHLVALRRSLDLSQADFEHLIVPLLKRLADLTGPLPASEHTHDHRAGGLISHLLDTAHRALSALRSQGYVGSDFHRDGALECAVLCAALAHDLGKICTDFKVYSTSGELWEPILESIGQFAAHTQATELLVQFNSGRGVSHDEALPLAAMQLLGEQKELLKFISRALPPWVLLSGHDGESNQAGAGDPQDQARPRIWQLVRVADRSASACGAAAGGLTAAGLELQNYLRAQLQGARVPLNDPTFGLFVIQGGVLLRQDSEALKLIEERFAQFCGDALPADTTASSALRTLGLYQTRGSLTLFSWYRLLLNHRQYYTKALHFKLHDSLSLIAVPAPEIIEIGVKSPELETLAARPELEFDSYRAFALTQSQPPAQVLPALIDPSTLIASAQARAVLQELHSRLNFAPTKATAPQELNAGAAALKALGFSPADRPAVRATANHAFADQAGQYTPSRASAEASAPHSAVHSPNDLRAELREALSTAPAHAQVEALSARDAGNPDSTVSAAAAEISPPQSEEHTDGISVKEFFELRSLMDRYTEAQGSEAQESESTPEVKPLKPKKRSASGTTATKRRSGTGGKSSK